ncbi:MAG: Ig-like domain-containing protein, partial [Limisphaerales bacterium]
MTRILRTTLIMVALFAATHFAHAQTTAVASGNWSSAATWGGTVPTGTEEDIVIPMGIDVLLDMDVECGELLVQGRLEVQRANRNLTCDSLIVMGANAEFEAGTDANRFTQRFVLTLKGETTENFEHHGHDMGARALLAMMGGTITMHGEDRVEWTRLGANVGAGATAITMSEAVDWRAGDEILICSSRLDWNEAEKMQVGSVTGGGLTVNLTSALAFPHLGVVKTYTRPSDSKQWTGDMRAEVGLLTRNITIQGAADSEATGFGAHVMIHGSMTVGPTTYPSGEAYVKGVEIFRGGQKSLLARYPFHWHLCEDAGAGQYFNDNSVHLSFNRAITIHGTDFATVENNFCYDHIGHGLFLEDGVERFNVIRRNVLVLTKRPAAGEEVIPSDNSFNEAQNRTPASFWITNPRNTFEDNVVAGTEGTAYWFIMPTGPTGPSASRAYYNGARPNREPLESFARNSAHSCMNGFDIFDILASNHSITRNGGWINNNDHIMDSCTFYANNTAIYAGIGTPGYQDNVIYRNNVFIDNQIVTMLATYLQVQESVIVADSGEGLFTDERKLFRAYDGAGQIRDSHLIGWNANNANLLFNTGGAIKHVNNRFAGITTDHAGTVRASMTDFDLPQQADAHANHVGHPRFWSLILRDEDGSLSGVPNSSIISNHRFMRVGDETQPANWTCVYSSPHHFVTAIEGAGANNVSVKRSKAGTPDAWIYYIHGYQEHHQLPFIVNEDFLYTYYYESLPSSRRTDFRIDDATAGDTVVARFKDFGKLPGVSVNTTAHGSLAALNASGSTGYYVEANGDLYLKMVATGQNQSRRVSWSSNPAWNEWDSDGDGLTDGTEAAIAARDPFNVTDMGAQFDTNGDFELWDQLSNITGGQVTGGSLIGTSTGDSQIINGDLGFAASDISVLMLRFKATVNTAVELFWERSNAPGYSGTRQTQVDYTTPGVWQVLFIPVDSHAEWNDTITGLRIDPIAGAGDFEIDWIRASNGDADGDGIPDMTEGFGDPDGDGLANLDDTESDGDGTSDAAENAAGRDPYNASDLGFKFSTDGDFEGWSFVRVSGGVSSGLLSGTATGPGHPNIQNTTGFRFAAGSVTDILIRLRVSSTRTIPFFFGTDTANNFSGTRRLLTASPSANQWGMVSFPVSTHADWTGFITRLRFDPTLAGATLDVDWILATDGDRDDDGLTDAAEGHEDADSDGSPNLDDRDSDGDGAPDAIESGFGRNPYANVEGGLQSDADGQNDLLEMIAGFSPVSSVFFFSQSVLLDPNGDRRITFSAKPNRTYQVERSRNLATWQQIGQVQSGSTDGNMDFVDAESLATGPVHYRLMISVVDGDSAAMAPTMSLTINEPPVATAQGVTVTEDVPKSITLNGSDPDMDPLTFAVVTPPNHGSLNGTAPNLTYTPNANYHGPDSFTFKVNDGSVDSAASTISLTVDPVNDPPVATAQSGTLNEDASLPITLAGSDIENDPLTFAVATGPSHGSLSGTAPNLTY